MSYSVLKMIEFTLDYLLRNDLNLQKISEGDRDRDIVIAYFERKIAECKAQAAQLQ